MKSGQRRVLSLPHLLYILRAMVIQPAQMQYTMNDHTVEFVGKILPIFNGILLYSINADIKFSVYSFLLCVVKSNYISIVIMSKELPVYLKN